MDKLAHIKVIERLVLSLAQGTLATAASSHCSSAVAHLLPLQAGSPVPVLVGAKHALVVL